jgi:nucleotide-binding universal stress UspA family protein
MKTILVPTEPSAAMQSTLETALLVARRYNSYIEGFAVRVAVPTVIAMDVAPSASLAFFEEENAEAARQSRDLFARFMQEHRVARTRAPQNAPAYGWLDDAPEGDNFVGQRGRVFDLIVIGRPSDDPGGPHMSTFEAALFESGRPVLLSPPAPPAQIGRNILIAWNCSTEQARATAFAMPFLAQAERVTILTVDGATVTGPSGEELAANLKLHGITAVTETLSGDNRTAGPMILERARALGCDLIVKGAYTQSRLRQLIFGGTTRHLLTHAELPLLTAH